MYPCFTVWVFIPRLYDKPRKFAIYICRLALVQGYHLEQKISHWLILTPWIKVHDWMCQSEHGCDKFSIDGFCQCIPSLLWFLILHDECINHQYFTSNILIVYFNKVPKVYASCCSLISINIWIERRHEIIWCMFEDEITTVKDIYFICSHTFTVEILYCITTPYMYMLVLVSHGISSIWTQTLNGFIIFYYICLKNVLIWLWFDSSTNRYYLMFWHIFSNHFAINYSYICPGYFVSFNWLQYMRMFFSFSIISLF